MGAVVTTRQLLEAGVHFGHQTRRWNPKMKRYIRGERNGIYLIDLEQTLTGIDKSYRFVREIAANGGTVLFVGTKKQSQEAIAGAAQRSGMPWINERWLGGMLTNFSTMSGRVKKMQEYQRMRAMGDFEVMPKKEALMIQRELEKLERNLIGIRSMAKLPDAIFVLDTKKEHICVGEANKLGIPVVAVVDTNCDPDVIDFVIPGNDDAIRSGTLMASIIAEAVEEGRFLAERRGVVTPPPPPTAEEEAARAAQQAVAREAAAAEAAARAARVVEAPETADAEADAPTGAEAEAEVQAEGTVEGSAEPDATDVAEGTAESIDQADGEEAS